MDVEYQSMMNNNTWKLVDHPLGKNPIGCKWIFKTKYKENGAFDKYKSRLVVKGYAQKEGINYKETFYPTTKIKTIGMIFALVEQFEWKVHQMEVKSAFLNGNLQEVYMSQQEGFIVPREETKVCRLIKSMYGIKQDAQDWYIKIDEHLTQHGFEGNPYDLNLYLKKQRGEIVIIVVHVDDPVITNNYVGNINDKKSTSRFAKLSFLNVICTMATMASLLAARLSRSSRLKPLFGNISRSNVPLALLLGGHEQVRSITSYATLDGPACRKKFRVSYNGLYKSFPYQPWTRSFASDKSELVEAVVPFMGESVTDGTLATFLKKPGDEVKVDEAIAQVETDKVTVDVTSPQAGYIEKFIAKEGDTVVPGTKVAIISKSAEGATPTAEKEKPSLQPSKPSPVADKKATEKVTPPSAAPVEGVSKDKEATPSAIPPSSAPPSKASSLELQLPPKDRERRVPMTRLRKRVATRLKDSQNTFALLTTFNDVDMTNLMQLRTEYKDVFLEKHGVKLGFMSGFIKAAVSALQHQPIVNAVIDGDDIIYRDYVDISIAVGTPKGLVVPVIRNAEKLNFAEIEKTMSALAKKANSGSISIDEMAGGTFTISNGGVYGSLLSTPIINPPQSAIL
ncbi:hypothetical protein KI387_032601, partial [Taxus chinensis]